MDKVEVAEAIGKKIIQSQHDFFEVNDSEDLYHITTLKRIIIAISDYLRLEDVAEDKIKALTDNFRQISKELYIGACITNKNQDGDEAVVRDESDTWFDYIYEKEKYPR